MRLLLAIAVYLLALVVIAAAAFFGVMVVAGPHAGLLPQWMEAIVLAAGWIAVLVVPVLAARRVWRRLEK